MTEPWTEPELPHKWREQAKAIGITEKTLYEFLKAINTTPEEFFRQFGPPPKEPWES